MGVVSLIMQIPTDAVEMPSDTVDELGIQFGNLGIGFGDPNESLGAAPEVHKVGVAGVCCAQSDVAVMRLSHPQEPTSSEEVAPIVLSPGSQPAKVPSPKPVEE